MESKDVNIEMIDWFYQNGYLNTKGKEYLIERMKGE
jgi:hypothetical protein